MAVDIQIIKGKKELTFPLIRVTKSINGKTGTATFLFIKPNCFEDFFLGKTQIKNIYLLSEKIEIKTNDLKILFQNGKPYLLKGIFIFKNSCEWFQFLNFMNQYSKEKGFIFESEKFL